LESHTNKSAEKKPPDEAGKYQEVPLGTGIFKETALTGVSAGTRAYIARNG